MTNLTFVKGDREPDGLDPVSQAILDVGDARLVGRGDEESAIVHAQVVGDQTEGNRLGRAALAAQNEGAAPGGA